MKFSLAAILACVTVTSAIIYRNDCIAASSVAACKSDSEAFIMSQNLVSSRLLTPASASYPWQSAKGVAIVRLPGCKFEVNAFVDAKNSSSSIVRSPYNVAIKPQDDGRWRATVVDVQAPKD